MVDVIGSSRFTITQGTRLVQSLATDIPQIKANTLEYATNGFLGVGITDTLFLIGHADGLEINNPYQVSDIREFINVVRADSESSLVRAFFDAYNEGARDIWVVAAASMDEYVIDVEDRNTVLESLGDKTFYEKYYERLDDTYSILREYGIIEMIVPVEASFYETNGVDFLTQLADHCSDSFDNTGNYRLGILGTRMSTVSRSDVQSMASDIRLPTLEANGKGKFISIMGGEASVSHPQMEIGYSTQASVLGAAKISITKANHGIASSLLKTAISPSFADWRDEDLSTLALAKINWLGRSTIGKRGVPYQTSIVTDNVLSPNNSTLWSVPQVRTMWKVLSNVKNMGNKYIGTVSFPQFKADVFDYMMFLVGERIIKNYSLEIYRDPEDRNLIKVDMGLHLYGNLRELFVSVGVGNQNMIG